MIRLFFNQNLKSRCTAMVLKAFAIILRRATHGITVEVPGLRTAYALPVPKQRSVFSYQLVGLHEDDDDS